MSKSDKTFTKEISPFYTSPPDKVEFNEQ